MSINRVAKHILSLTIKKVDGCQIQTCKILLYDRKLICLKILNQCQNTIQLCYSSLAGPLNSVCFLCRSKIQDDQQPFSQSLPVILGLFFNVLMAEHERLKVLIEKKQEQV